MNGDTKNTLTIYPWPTIITTIVFIFFLGWGDFSFAPFLSQKYFDTREASRVFHILLFTVHAGVVYLIYYFFFLSPIKIVANKLILPSMDDKGVPSLLFWGKTSIDIYSIRKINKFRDHASSLDLLATWNIYSWLSFREDKIVIVYGQSAIEVNISFYGANNVDILAEHLWTLNEKIDIVDRG